MPEISRIAFTVLGFPIYWYGLLIAVGLVLGVLTASLREKKLGLKKDTALDFLLWALPAALICARAYYVAFTWPHYAGHPLSVFNFREGGLAIYGGVIGGILAALAYTRWKKIPFGALADLCAPALALGQAIGRWGNFFNQEAYGVAQSDPALQFFPLSVFIEADGLWHAATFFYESAWCFAVFAALLLFEKKGAFKRRGDLFAAYLYLYAAERVVVEGLRMDSLMLGALRVSQLLSAALMLGALAYILPRARRRGDRAIALFCAAALAVGALAACVHLAPLPVQLALAALSVLFGAAFYRAANPAA
ncbi:MAG: prolipoprotein diacylglyceryl transferase [Clostridia bacterium]|nr:prolipoprotein diacylglyceryl transferase [Clostridia bacterium]